LTVGTRKTLVLSEDFGLSGAVDQQVQDVFNRQPRAANDRLADHDTRIDDDAIEQQFRVHGS